MLSNEELIKNLNDLIQVDIDAVHAYGKSIEHIDIPAVREHAVMYQGDHERHISDLSAIVRRLGGTPPEFSKDFKGFMLEGFAALRSMTGNEGALKALKSGEEFTNKKYNDARMWAVPTDILSIIEKNYEDELKHLHYVEQAIENKVWEVTGARK